MLRFLKKLCAGKATDLDEKIARLNYPLEEHKFSRSLDENVAVIKKLFNNVDIVQYKMIQSPGKDPIRYFLIFIDGVVHSEIVNNNIVEPLMTKRPEGGGMLLESLLATVVQVGESKKINTFKALIENVTHGDTVLFTDGCDQAAVFNTKQFALRSITEPENEKVLSGPREGFTESLIQNLSLILRRARTNELKTKTMTLGKRTQTTVCICYLDSLANKDVLEELLRRLNKIDIDGILDSNYITEQIHDFPNSPFRTVGSTERPDVVLGKLLEGRIAILVDNTPVALTVPYLFIENFQVNEDYYFNFYYSSFSRLLRIMGFFLTLAVPGLYIAVVAFHQEILPLQLLIRIALERQNVPLPANVEAVIMLIVFDVLRETGVRMPSNIGQALSIVGALVIGQAAVEASLVAAPMIIVVAATGITSLLVPKLNAPIIFWRMLLLLLASSFGFFGLTIGLSLLFIHLNNLKSFGVDHLSLEGNFSFQKNKDIFIRSPWPDMIERPEKLSENEVRQQGGGNNG